jgi:hypothetical protein
MGDGVLAVASSGCDELGNVSERVCYPQGGGTFTVLFPDPVGPMTLYTSETFSIRHFAEMVDCTYTTM